ncbi:MAG: SH3 domain-containing protein [Gammaproteobacteria bacterium]|nr:SH3 domain-containing protein [Gammaproteobacteria bacterium]
MRKLALSLLILQLSMVDSGLCAERALAVVIEDPYIELHSGPGRGYPIFYVAERGEQIEVLKRRTDWFKIRIRHGEEGWVNDTQLARTFQLNGEPTELPGYSLADYGERRWEFGVLYGDFGGANVVSTYGAFSMTENLSVELWLSDMLGRFSNSQLVNVNIVHMLFPEWRASPFFTLGTGVIHTEPKGTIVATTDRTDNLAHVGVGVRTYITRRLLFRAEYKTYVVFTSRDDNQEVSEWKAGFSFFF